LHRRIGEFEGRSRFATWLYRITRNVALERRRGDARRSALLAREVVLVDEPSATPDDVTDIPRIRRLIAPHFDALPPRQREVFELIELRGLTAAEVAARLGIDASTVRVLLLRARRTVRARLLALHPALLEDFRP
jgi:RNA polymerase sigma-70 factor (ECF subfamily)